MRLFIVLTICLATVINGMSQSIKGHVFTDKNSPVINATVSLLSAKDSSLLRTSITNEKGEFIFLLTDTAGDPAVRTLFQSHLFLLQASSLGFQTRVQRITSDNETVVTLATAVKVMAAVEVTAKRPMIEVRPDKIVFNVENSVNAAGNTAFDLLRKSPGVLIDNNDNISLLGNGVAVYIDGKPSPLTSKDLSAFLRTLQSTDIEAIELIKNPSARYDAAGTGGIINIRLKKNKNLGLNGSATASYGIGIFAKYNNSLALNYRNKKINAFASYSNYFGNNESYINLYREQNDSIYDQKSTNISHYRGQNVKAGVDYFINSKNTIGFMGSVFSDNWQDHNRAETPISSIKDHNTGNILLANNSTTGNKQNDNFNLNHHYKDTSGREWNTDLDYGYFTTYQDAVQPNSYLSADRQTMLEEKDYTIVTSRRINLFTVKTDYEQPFAGGQLSIGAKSSFVKTANNFNFFNLINNNYLKDTGLSNNFQLTENIYAGYLNYQRKIKKWDLQAGLRMEHTTTRGVLSATSVQNDQDIKRSYTDFFPSFALAYAMNRNNGLNLNFSRRINRPGYQNLNPFESKLDELTYQKGNPFLKPEYTNSISLTHTYKYKLNTSIGYSRTTDFFAQITDTIERKRNYIQQRNAGTQDNVYINISYPINVFKWWSIYMNAGANRLSNRVNLGPGYMNYLAVVSYNFYSQHTISFPKKYVLEISGFFNSPTIWGGTFKNKSFWGVDAGMQKRLLNDKLTMKAAVSDIFNSMHWRGISNFAGLYMDAGGGWESRQFKLSCTYRFGRTAVKAHRNRTTGSDDINTRL